MTFEEKAIEKLKNIAINLSQTDGEQAKIFFAAASALEKQILTKPLIEIYPHTTIKRSWRCRGCGGRLLADFKYCPGCGQAIDWSNKK